MGHQSFTRAEILVIAALSGWALFQNFWRIGSTNLLPDEPVYAGAGWAYVHGNFAPNQEHPFTAKYLMGLAQLILGQGVHSDRIAAAAATLLSGVIIWGWVRRDVDRWTALVAAALWLLLPGWIWPYWGPRLYRFGLLEPFMIMFTLAAAALAWRWYRTRGVAPLVLSAICLALAGTSKMSAFAMAPVLVAFPLIRYRDQRAVVQGALYTFVTVGVTLTTYLPAGNPFVPIGRMLDAQLTNDIHGHLVEIAGQVTAFPPWWANLWWLAAGVGGLACVGLAGGMILMIVFRPNGMLCLFVGSVLMAVAAFYLVISSVALVHYYALFIPWICILAAIGLTAPWRSRPRPVWVRTSGRVSALLCCVCLIGACVVTTVHTVQLRRLGVARVADTLAELGVPPGPVLVTGLVGWEWQPYLDDVITRPGPEVSAIVVHRGWLRDKPDPKILAMVDGHPDEYEQIQLDQVELYVPRRVLKNLH